MDFKEIMDKVFYKTDKNTGERKVSCCKLIIVVFIIFMIIGILTGGGSSKSNSNTTNLEDLNINVPKDFRVEDNASCCIFKSADRNVVIRILEGDEGYSDGYSKYDGAILVNDHVTELEKRDDFYFYSLGEYVLIDGHKYWVEVSNDDLHMKSSDNVSEVMNYLNSHNDWEFVSS